MRKIRITVKKIARYDDLIGEYENPIEHACSMQLGQEFLANGYERPENFCESAWEVLSPFMLALAYGGENFYDGWMKNPRSAMISCNDGFRPVSFLLEALEDETESQSRPEAVLGKTLIVGDSYSTFEGAIPAGYDSWYFQAPSSATDVHQIEQTWWYGLFDGKTNVLLRNESYSGTTVCNSVRPEHTIDCSFINRFDSLIESGFFEKNKVDTILVFGTTNDSWTDCPIGETQFEDFSQQDLFKVLPACGYLAQRMAQVAPGARICWLINTELKEEIVDGILQTAEHFGQESIRFTHLDKLSGHPSIQGMKQIADAVKKQFG